MYIDQVKKIQRGHLLQNITTHYEGALKLASLWVSSIDHLNERTGFEIYGKNKKETIFEIKYF